MNFTIEVGLGILCALLDVYLVIINIQQIKHGMKYQFYYLSTCLWFFLMIAYFFWAFAIALLSTFIFKIAAIFGCVGFIFMAIKNDVLKRENIDPIKLIFLIVLTAILVFLLFYIFPDDITVEEYANKDLSISYSLRIGALYLCIMAIAEGYYVYNCYLIYKKAPKTMKRMASIYLAGMLISIFSGLIFITPIRSYVPGIFFIMNGISAIIIVKAYLKEPKLLFILPFKALRLIVVDTRGGIPLFNHTWNKHSDLTDDVLFSGMMQGVISIMKESINKGEIQEIKLKNAFLLANSNSKAPISCFLIATKLSRSLRDGFALFTERFYVEFKDIIQNAKDLTPFLGAEKLVNECFPHIPVFDE